MRREVLSSAGGMGSNSGRAPCRVVGLGASAGGLAVLKDLFGVIPAHTGAAFVVVVHLAPERPSHLADLLQPYCAMPVLQVSETVRIEPDRVYVIPPDADLDAVDTHLRLSTPDRRRHQRSPIDHFFATLAETHGSDAAGILLSGGGRDGTEGLRRLRDRGGLGLVQDPQEAEFAGMPRNAIHAGVVDGVLPLHALGDEILGFCRGERPAAERPAAAAGDADTIRDIIDQLHLHTCADARWYQRRVLTAAIRRRMQSRRLQTPAAYLQELKGDPEEPASLLEDMLDGRSGFFADGRSMALIEDEVIPALFSHRSPNRALRAWSVGCGNGEEAYGVAMLLLEEAERRREPPQIRVFATDLRRSLLQQAREGCYPTSIAAHVSPERLERFFSREERGYQVRSELRDLVVFTPHNLFEDPPFVHLNFVLCRGLMRDLEPHGRARAAELLRYALDPGGLLMLEPGESRHPTPHFVPRRPGVPLLWRRDGHPPRRASDGASAVAASDPARRAADAGRRLSGLAHAALYNRIAAQHAPPGVLVDVNDDVRYYSPQVGRYLKMQGGTPSHHLPDLASGPLREALERCLSEVRRSGSRWQSPTVTAGSGSGTSELVLLAEAVEAEGLIFIAFQETGEAVTSGPTNSEQAAAARDQQHLHELQEELHSAREEFQAVVEELETSKEELQSTNEELATINEENLHRIEELDQLSADQRHLLEASGIATVFLDRKLRIVRFTAQARSLLHLRDGDRGRPLSDLLTLLSETEFAADAQRVLDTLEHIDREVRSGEGRWYLRRLLPYRTASGRADGVVVSLIDINDRRLAELALEEADRRKDQFLATLAHELRNPLAPICTGLELLQAAGDDAVQRENVRRRLDRQTRQLVRLVDDLMDVSRITRGTFQLRKSRTDLADAVRDAVVATEQSLEKAGQNLEVELPDEPLFLYADGVRLTQVLSNLLSNAVKYTAAGGRIGVSGARNGDQAVITVSDSGIGIPADELDHVFEMFTQLDSEREAGYGGLGIGLSLAKSLVEMHGGTLTVESEGAGLGSRFIIRLPLDRTGRREAATARRGEGRVLECRGSPCPCHASSADCRRQRGCRSDPGSAGAGAGQQ